MIKPFPRPRKPNPRNYGPLRRQFMTICIGALAAGGEAIVCVADKAVTIGDYIQADADSTKILRVNDDNRVALIAGSDDVLDLILQKLTNSNLPIDSLQDILSKCQEICNKVTDELIETRFLHPKLLTKDKYIQAITNKEINKYMESIAMEIADGKPNYVVLLCGFSDQDKPYIISLRPDIVTDNARSGFQAIGSGFEFAMARMLWSKSKRSHSIGRVLYDAFDAKANAEMDPGVGFEWDAQVIIKGKSGPIIVSNEIKELIEQVWDKANRSPFEKRDPLWDLPNPPRDWKEQLEKYSKSLLSRRSISQKSKDQP